MSENQFSITLYDKLWTNIVHKENRLWTFLSVYGAVIGLVIGTGLAGNLQPISTLIILVLTYWAGELTIDTDWWSIRNRTIIIQIEKKFPDETKFVIPGYYQDPKYATSSLYNVSLYVFAAVGLSVLLYNYYQLLSTAHMSSDTVLFSALLYIIWSLILVRWAYVRESRIKEYFDLYQNLNPDFEMTENELCQYRTHSFRIAVFAGHILLALALAYRLVDISGLLANWPFASLELALIGTYSIALS